MPKHKSRKADRDLERDARCRTCNKVIKRFETDPRGELYEMCEHPGCKAFGKWIRLRKQYPTGPFND
jgi:hypothetical protein